MQFVQFVQLQPLISATNWHLWSKSIVFCTARHEMLRYWDGLPPETKLTGSRAHTANKTTALPSLKPAGGRIHSEATRIPDKFVMWLSEHEWPTTSWRLSPHSFPNSRKRTLLVIQPYMSGRITPHNSLVLSERAHGWLTRFPNPLLRPLHYTIENYKGHAVSPSAIQGDDSLWPFASFYNISLHHIRVLTMKTHRDKNSRGNLYTEK